MQSSYKKKKEHQPKAVQITHHLYTVANSCLATCFAFGERLYLLKQWVSRHFAVSHRGSSEEPCSPKEYLLVLSRQNTVSWAIRHMTTSVVRLPLARSKDHDGYEAKEG